MALVLDKSTIDVTPALASVLTQVLAQSAEARTAMYMTVYGLDGSYELDLSGAKLVRKE